MGPTAGRGGPNHMHPAGSPPHRPYWFRSLQMFPSTTRLARATLAFSFLFISAQARAQFDELVHKVPFTANAIFLVNVDTVLASPPAVAANWKTKPLGPSAAGITILPSDATHAVMAAHFDFDTMVSLWESAILR